MRQTLQKIRQLADRYIRSSGMPYSQKEAAQHAFEAGYLAAVEHERIPEDKLPLPRCYQCSPGVMRPTGAVAMTNPPWHMFKCDKCGTTMDISQEDFLKIDAKLIHNSQFNLNSKKYRDDYLVESKKIAEQLKETTRKLNNLKS